MIWFVGFFAVVFSVNGIMVYLALKSWGGLETTDAYRKGLFFNQEIERAQQQQNSGWVLALTHVPSSLKDDRLDLQITRPLGSLPPAGVSAHLFRPVAEGHDQLIQLDHTGQGLYTAPLTLPLAGQWDVKILVKGTGDTTYKLEQRIFVK